MSCGEILEDTRILNKGETEMPSMRDLLTKAFVADVVIKVESLGKNKVPEFILGEIHHLLRSKYSTLLDKEKGTIYLKSKGA